MELLICIAAAIVAWVVRGIWYMLLDVPFGRASNVPVSNRGDPSQTSALPYIVAGTCLLAMAVFLRALFLHYGIDNLGKGFGIGLGIGTLIGAPLVFMHNMPPQRPAMLTLIDGGHSILVCTTLGTILGAL